MKKPSARALKKRELYERTFTEYMQENEPLIEERGLAIVADMAKIVSQAVADKAFPTTKQRKQRAQQSRAHKTWLASVKKGVPPALPEPPARLKRAALHGYFGALPAARTAKEPNGSYAAFVNIDGKSHRLCYLPDEETAQRVARVARAAAWCVFGHRGGDGPAPGDTAASACVSADFQLGLKRKPGRPSTSVLRRPEDDYEPLTSSWVVQKVGALLGMENRVPALKVVEVKVPKVRGEEWADVLVKCLLGPPVEHKKQRSRYYGELAQPVNKPPPQSLLTLSLETKAALAKYQVETGGKLPDELWSAPAADEKKDAETRKEIMEEAARWRNELIAKYQAEGLATPENLAIIKEAAERYAKRMLGYTPTDLEAYEAAEATASEQERTREMKRKQRLSGWVGFLTG